MLTAKETSVQIQMMQSKDTSMPLMVHVSCAQVVKHQVTQIQPTDSEPHVLLVELHAMAASNIQTTLDAKHVLEPKLSTSKEMDVPSDQTA